MVSKWLKDLLKHGVHIGATTYLLTIGILTSVPGQHPRYPPNGFFLFAKIWRPLHKVIVPHNRCATQLLANFGRVPQGGGPQVGIVTPPSGGVRNAQFIFGHL